MSLRWKLGMKSWPRTQCFRVCVTSVPQRSCRTDATCPFLGYPGTLYISWNMPVAIKSFMSFFSHFPLQNETPWEIWPSAKKKNWVYMATEPQLTSIITVTFNNFFFLLVEIFETFFCLKIQDFSCATESHFPTTHNFYPVPLTAVLFQLT